MPSPFSRHLALAALVGLPYFPALAGTPAAASSPVPQASIREMSTDRPDKTESPITVAPGKFQIEAELFNWTRNRDAGVKTDAFDVGIFNFKYGVSHNVDLQVVVESYHYEKSREAGSKSIEEGFGDITLRSKINFWGNDGDQKTAFGIMPYVTLPTASHRAGVPKVEAGVILPFAVELSDRLGLGMMTEIDYVIDEDGGYTWNWVNSITLSVSVTEKLGTYVEFYSEIPLENSSAWVATADAGITYAISENVQWDMGVNVGLTEAADDLQVFTGVTYRF